MKTVGALAVITLICAAGQAFAVDGVIEINQAKALAGGVTLGDTAGFPVTISAPGSYRLTSRLERIAGSNDEPLIQITNGDVTLDLNGFPVYGPGKFGSGAGIRATATGHVAVKNGTVRNFGGPGISVDGPASIDDVIVRDTGGTGIACVENCRIRRCLVSDNGVDGLFTGAQSVVESTVARNNTRDGISVGRSSVVAACTSSENGRDGIALFGASVARGNSSAQNGSNGIDATDSGSNVVDNIVSLNTDVDLNLSPFTGYGGNVMIRAVGSTVSGGVQTATNVCNGLVCP